MRCSSYKYTRSFAAVKCVVCSLWRCVLFFLRHYIVFLQFCFSRTQVNAVQVGMEGMAGVVDSLLEEATDRCVSFAAFAQSLRVTSHPT